MKRKEWKISYTKPDIPPELVNAGFSPLLAAVLSLRKISSVDDAHAFIDCGSEYLLDPMLISGMAEAKDRISLAVSRRETVAVYGDYDVDGITSTCLVTEYLRSKGLTCHPYIPDRNEEGYGLNSSALDSLKELGVSLVITVDCGITAKAETDYARSIGIDMIITDHHECHADSIPKAVAVIDCKQEKDDYPNKFLAGVGVALKLVCACEGNDEIIVQRFADLVAIGTIADVMPLIGENRYLVKVGLKKLETEPRPGIKAMLIESGVDVNKLNAAMIGYSLAPRLNAAGRLGQAATAGKLLMSENEEEAGKLAAELCELNRQRQKIENDIWQEANQLISGTVPDAPIVLASDKWHQGVIGIAASRLSEQYSLPAIMICLTGDVGKGSCRSYGGFNLFEALSSCSEHLISFGGHALAAGLNIRRDKLDSFRYALSDYYHRNRPETLPEVQCDILIGDPALLSIDNVKSLDLLEPYGNANLKPTMCISDAVLENLSAVGGGKHLRMRIKIGFSSFECIFFSHTAKDFGIKEGDRIDLAFTPQINDYRGHVTVQLLVTDVRIHDCAELCRRILENDRSIRWAAAPYCPERADFVQLWRSIPEDFIVGSDVDSVLAQCPVNMLPERFCLCLMVLLETGLLKSNDGGIFGAVRSSIEGKADLEATELIRSLNSI